ncbi:DGQHR domain-containing protein [Paenibacillus sp. MMS18-CY102]|uniref:DGQHR domain-containing protein n=1 Tax=Paenibacillus sp. MMS18-CY102 TaxID=2682849 RepID=UPI0013658A67|nr:DGQHR domain-containing protein [Paenibacillus sp. MMS18-CY102]MWC31364.1 DGQHR domain-containing protein [Paenibacillus sp. MMS18-CY102]
MTTLPSPIVIENVLQSKLRGKVVYQSFFSANIGLGLIYVKPFDHPSGKGYQRPVDKKRCDDFCKYLSQGEEAQFTPILLNASGNWEFSSYDLNRQNIGRLICKGKASLMDGQHRMGGTEQYIQQTNSEINIPFLCYHYLDEDEEIKLFDTINTKAKGIGSSLSRFLRRDSDDISWVATEMMIRPTSPFNLIGSIIGKRSKGRHVTLQNLYRTLHLLTSDNRLAALSKDEKLDFAIRYYSEIQQTCSEQWNDYKGYRISHIVCLDALSMAGKNVWLSCFKENKRNIDYERLQKSIKKLAKVDWSINGPLKYIKGLSGSKSLATDLIELMVAK